MLCTLCYLKHTSESLCTHHSLQSSSLLGCCTVHCALNFVHNAQSFYILKSVYSTQFSTMYAYTYAYIDQKSYHNVTRSLHNSLGNDLICSLFKQKQMSECTCTSAIYRGLHIILHMLYSEISVHVFHTHFK